MTPEERFRKSGGIRMVGNRRPDHNPTYSPAPDYMSAPGLGNAKIRPVPKVNSLMSSPTATPAIKPTTQTQKQLFGGQIKSLFPSLSPDLTRRRKARNFSVRNYSTLGA